MHNSQCSSYSSLWCICLHDVRTQDKKNLSKSTMQGCINHNGNDHHYPMVAINWCNLDGLVESLVVFPIPLFHTHWVLYKLQSISRTYVVQWPRYPEMIFFLFSIIYMHREVLEILADSHHS